LAEFEDLVPSAQLLEVDWVPKFVAHPLVTLVKWGLIDAHEGFTSLTADEVLHIAADQRVWGIEFTMSATAVAIEQALGRTIWVAHAATDPKPATNIEREAAT
jgi:hypothetical protein